MQLAAEEAETRELAEVALGRDQRAAEAHASMSITRSRPRTTNGKRS
jgi:hypothetical protein